MKQIYIVLHDNVYNEFYIEGVFESIEDAKAYIESRRFPNDYELVDWVDYYESGAKERFGW